LEGEERVKRVWVIGGTSGIGEATAHHLNRRTDVERVRVEGVETLDARDFQALLSSGGEFNPTHVVYAAGFNKLDWIPGITLKDFRRVMEVNVYGFLTLMQALDVIDSARSVVAITSDAAWRPMRTSAVYCSSKAALEMAVRVASREYAPKGWRINAVAPGKVAETGMTEYVDKRVLELRGWTKEFAEEYERQSSPLGRKVTKTEVAEVIESVLFGPAAQTGEIIAVNGGR
jgi:NAD(P)-dependent dehydrogenase (short-subunit alcohol dehydrogenase family)